MQPRLGPGTSSTACAGRVTSWVHVPASLLEGITLHTPAKTTQTMQDLGRYRIARTLLEQVQDGPLSIILLAAVMVPAVMIPAVVVSAAVILAASPDQPGQQHAPSQLNEHLVPGS